VFESFAVEQTGGFVMVPTFYLNDGRSIGFIWDVEHWLMSLYDERGEPFYDSPAIPDSIEAILAELHKIVSMETQGGDRQTNGDSE
jgi:hypothetical protein